MTIAILLCLALSPQTRPMNYADLRLSDSGHHLLALASDEARRLRHDYIGTEHLVLALSRQSDGVAATALRNLRFDMAQVEATINGHMHSGSKPVPPGAFPFTTRTQKVFALATESARSFGESNVSAEHLLIGVLQEGVCIGAQVLKHHGLSHAAVIAEIKQLRGMTP